MTMIMITITIMILILIMIMVMMMMMMMIMINQFLSPFLRKTNVLVGSEFVVGSAFLLVVLIPEIIPFIK